MTKSELRQHAYRIMGVEPEYKGPILPPTCWRNYATRDDDLVFFSFLGEACLKYLNARRK